MLANDISTSVLNKATNICRISTLLYLTKVEANGYSFEQGNRGI
jgi:hypothetical protein